jgi:2-iminobutanoate/2-iminopropanoate deaminase
MAVLAGRSTGMGNMLQHNSGSILLLLLFAACAATERVHLPAEGALGPYSASVSAGGVVAVSGQISPASEFSVEAEQVLRKVERELQRAGLGLADVISCTVFLTDMEHYSAFNEVYARVLTAPYPARACVAVKALPGGARVEVQVFAIRR